MFDKLKNLFVKPRDDRDGWLTADNPAELNLAKSFQRTGVINQMNFISMMQDPVTQQYWIEHVSAVGQAEEYEYQPISKRAAAELIDNPDLLQKYVLHPWVK